MPTLHRIPRFAILVAFVLGSLALAGGAATSQQATGTPLLRTSLVTGPGDLVVQGERFTPGADVFIAVQDPWGERAPETRWTTASAVTFDMLGHDDPALGYRPGGTVREVFSDLCGEDVMVRAYDTATASWSNVLDITPACE
jgi:hypothetical protein